MEVEQKAVYSHWREEEAKNRNADISGKLEALDELLADSLSVNEIISFDGLRISERPPSFAPPLHLAQQEPPPSEAS